MKMLGVKVVDPPAVLPVTVDEFINHGRLNGITVQREPELLTRELTAATGRGEEFCRRSFITQKLTAIFAVDWDQRPDQRGLIVLPRGDVQSVESVEAAGMPAPADSYVVDTTWGTIQLTTLAGETASVVWVSGYGDAGTDVPDPIREGILQYATVLYEDRVGSRETKYAASATGTLPRGIRDIWRPFQVELSG
jgi:uncharacterized phiE125 gp8 family phage protein